MENSEQISRLPTQPETHLQEPEAQTEAKPESKRRLTFVILAAVILLIGLACLGYRLASTTQSTRAGGAAADSPLSASTVTFHGVKAAYITLPLTARQAELDPIYSSVPSWDTAAGHYLVIDPRGVTFGVDNSEGGKLLYDGKVVYDGPYIYNFTLSANGQHYAYELDTDKARSSKGNLQIYIDGKLIKTIADSRPIYHMQISNDGRHYAYFTPAESSDQSDGMDIIEDDKTIYSSGFVEAMRFDADLHHFIIMQAAHTSSPDVDIVVDGKVKSTNVAFMGAALPNVAISDNGAHYMYTDGANVYVDGIKKDQVKSLAAMMILDSGKYVAADPVSNRVYTSDKAYAVQDDFGKLCSPGCGESVLSMTPDGMHYIYGTETPSVWNVDGYVERPTGDILSADFVNDTAYMYRWHE